MKDSLTASILDPLEYNSSHSLLYLTIKGQVGWEKLLKGDIEQPNIIGPLFENFNKGLKMFSSFNLWYIIKTYLHRERIVKLYA